MCSSPANFGSLSTCCKFEICVFNSPSAVESAWRGKEKAVVSTRTNSPKAAVNLLFIVLPVYLKSSTRIFHDATPRIFHKAFLSALTQPGSVILFLPPSPSNMLRSLAVYGGSFDSGQCWARLRIRPRGRQPRREYRLRLRSRESS